MRFPTMWYVQPAKPQISLCIRLYYAQSDQSLCLSVEYSVIVKLLTEHHLEFLSLKRGCRGSSKSTLIKMSNCWKSQAMAQILEVIITVHLMYWICYLFYRTINGFLNTGKGGTVYLGIIDSGVIKGIQLTLYQVNLIYRKTCLKRPLKNRQNKDLTWQMVA